MSSTSQIDKGFPYSFLWSWLGSGLLTSTGIVLEKCSATISTVIEQHSALVSKVMVNHSDTVSKVYETHYATVGKVTFYIQLLLITLFIHIRLQLVRWLKHVSRLLVTTVYLLPLSSQFFRFCSTFDKYISRYRKIKYLYFWLRCNVE